MRNYLIFKLLLLLRGCSSSERREINTPLQNVTSINFVLSFTGLITGRRNSPGTDTNQNQTCKVCIDHHPQYTGVSSRKEDSMKDQVEQRYLSSGVNCIGIVNVSCSHNYRTFRFSLTDFQHRA